MVKYGMFVVCVGRGQLMRWRKEYILLYIEACNQHTVSAVYAL